MGLRAVSAFMSRGVTSVEFCGLLRACVNDVPALAIRVIGDRQELVGVSGGLQPLGVISGMVFAMVARASYSARTTWFEFLDWLRVSRMLCGLVPTHPADKSAGDAVSGFEKVVLPAAFDDQSGRCPPSLATSPAFGGSTRMSSCLRSVGGPTRRSRSNAVTAPRKCCMTGKVPTLGRGSWWLTRTRK